MIKVLIISLLALSASAQLRVWSSFAVHCPPCAEKLDSSYAELYLDFNKYGRVVNKLHFVTDTIYPWDSYTLYVHAQIPPDADFQVAMRTDSTIWSILYDWKDYRDDNDYSKPRIDTVLTIHVPSYSIFHYGQAFAQFTILYNQYQLPRASQLSALVDAVFLVRHSPEDTITRDTISDTIKLSVQPPLRSRLTTSRGHAVDILGRLTDSTSIYCITRPRRIIVK